MIPVSLEPHDRDLARRKGRRGRLGLSALGKQCEHVTFFVFFDSFGNKWKEITNLVRFAWIGLLSVPRESLHLVLDFSAVFETFFEETWGNIKFVFHIFYLQT